MSNCPIKEQTGDGAIVGRCCYHLPDGITCPRHGDVSEYVKRFDAGAGLTLENSMRRDRGESRLEPKS